MDEDSPEKAKADRALLIIYLMVGVGTVLPLVLFFYFR